ncbi:MAG TPA: STAS domain-containing protein [Acidobacteriota bacterium]|nr:STAS domain-containing protein [Acidobacteriota bacterium]
MEVKVSTEKGRVPITVMHVDGNIDSSTYGTFQAKADELIEKGSRYFLIDLSHAPYISSAGLRALHSLYNKLRSLNPDANLSEEDVRKGISAGTYKSPHLKLLNLSKEARTAFQMGGFDMYIETFNDMKSAIEAF